MTACKFQNIDGGGLFLAHTSSVSQNTHILAYKPQLLVSLRFNKINNLN